MSFHLSCTETILVICFRSVIKRQKNCEDTQDKWCKEHLWFGFLKNAENFFGGENTRFVYHCIRLGILHFVHTQPLPRLRALVLFYRKRFLHQCWHRTRMLLISFICRGIFCIKEKNLPGSFIDPDFRINIIIFSSSYIKLSENYKHCVNFQFLFVEDYNKLACVLHVLSCICVMGILSFVF